MAKAIHKGLRLRKLADKSDITQAKVLGVDENGNPVLGGWPFAGIKVEDDVLTHIIVPDGDYVTEASKEGWLALEGAEVVHRPGGPPSDDNGVLWSSSHTFVHAEAIVIKTIDGDLRYRVTHQPDKYAESGDDHKVTDEKYAAGETRVDHFYLAELETTTND